MAGSPTPTDCRFDEPCNATDVDEIDWEVSLTDQFGRYDALGPLSVRDACPGPPRPGAGLATGWVARSGDGHHRHRGPFGNWR